MLSKEAGESRAVETVSLIRTMPRSDLRRIRSMTPTKRSAKGG